MVSTGTKFGPYETLAKLGAGGMGEVYRARDTKLNREVALKVLPEAFAQDPQRLARFKREAQVLASLNHPNIAAIHGLEESNGVLALVMELVEGETLAERISHRVAPGFSPAGADLKVGATALAPDDALPIARQMAEALEYAHEKGVIHRDLKPANIKITPEGTVKVLDFGLAKALDPSLTFSPSPSGRGWPEGPGEGQNSPTLSDAATRAGMILGTAGYMSPEQAKGKLVDRRADIWAFGCVLYEMLAGKRAFEGETLSDTLAAVLRAEPDWEALPEETPAAIQTLTRRCLMKDPKQRLRDIGDARITIEETLSGADVAPVPRAGPAPADLKVGATPGRVLPWVVAGIAIAALLATLVIFWRATRSASSAPIELSLNVPSGLQLGTGAGPAVILSLDGSRIAFVVRSSSGGRQIYVRELDSSEAKPVEGATGTSPFFSPDGRWIGFYGDNGKLEKVSVLGGAPVVLCDAAGARGGWWGKDGTIVFTPTFTAPLYRISAAGGTPTPVTHLDKGRDEITHRWPQVLPGGKSVIFTASADNNNYEHAYVEAASLSTGKARVLARDAYFGRYLSSGLLAYVSGGTLFAVPFDVKNLKLTGTAMPVLANLQADLTNGSAQTSFSQTGTAAYLTGRTLNSQVTVALVDGKGVATPLVKQPGDYSAPRFSPDGKRLALQVGGNISVYDLARGTMTPLTFSPAGCTMPVWTPDGKMIACSRTSGAEGGLGISWLPADGSGSLKALTYSGGPFAYPSSWSPDARTLAYFEFSRKTGQCCEIWMLPVSASGQPGQPKLYLAQGAYTGGAYPQISPDGRWVAYESGESGVTQVYVVPFPGPGGRWQVSVAGGWDPRWSKAGDKLFFDRQNGNVSLVLVEVPYTFQGNSFQPGKPKALFEGAFAQTYPYSPYDVAPDGKHFAILVPAGEKSAARASPTVVIHWSDRVTRLVAAGQK